MSPISANLFQDLLRRCGKTALNQIFAKQNLSLGQLYSYSSQLKRLIFTD